MTAPRGRRNSDRAEQRRLILDHARRLFAEAGYTNTTLEQIAESAGVSVAVLQRHFPEKIALVHGLVEELLASTLRAWLEQTDASPDPMIEA